jgi:hypothetical protein
MLFALAEAEPDAMGFVVNARHREFLPEEQAICSASAFVRMRGFVFSGMKDGEIRSMEPMVAASLMYGSAIRIICLRLTDWWTHRSNNSLTPCGKEYGAHFGPIEFGFTNRHLSGAGHFSTEC